MPFKTILFLIFFSSGCLLSIFYHPFLGVLTYIVNYNISPTDHWWGKPLLGMGLRYAQLSAISIAIGLILHNNKIKYKSFLHSQEILMFLLIFLMWLSHFWGLPPGELTNQNALKMTKVLIFLLMFSHIVTSKEKYEVVIWTLIILGLYLGYAAYTAPSWAFKGGRLNIGVGGPDFREGNFLGAHFAMLLPFIGIKFLKGGWKSKIICILTAVFVINAIILVRSRGVFIGCALGFITALAFAVKYMKGKRKKIILWAILGIIGVLMLTDPDFWYRMMTLNKAENLEELDLSAKGRLWAWQAALEMVKQYPLGIGEGNFKQYVGEFDERIPGKDTHNTYLRCLAELGVPGFIILLMLILNSFLILKKSWEISKIYQFVNWEWHIFALTISLIIFLSCGFFITETYIEEFYWLLMFPVILYRCIENEIGGK